MLLSRALTSNRAGRRPRDLSMQEEHTPDMGISRTLAFYLAREILYYGALGLVIMLTIFVSQNLLRQLGDLVAIGFSPSDFVVVIRCLVPTLLAYAVPIAFLFGALLAILRLCSDREITAMSACGQSLG